MILGLLVCKKKMVFLENKVIFFISILYILILLSMELFVC